MIAIAGGIILALLFVAYVLPFVFALLYYLVVQFANFTEWLSKQS